MSKFFKTSSSKALYQVRIEQSLKTQIDKVSEEAKTMGLGTLDLTPSVEKAITNFIDGAEKELNEFKKEKAKSKVKTLEEKIERKAEKSAEADTAKTEHQATPASKPQPINTSDEKPNKIEAQNTPENKPHKTNRFSFGN